MKGCLAYEIVRLMSEGLNPQEACEKAGYVATGEKEPQTGGIIYRNDKGYEISIAQKVNPWNGYATSYCRVGFRAPQEITQYVE